MSTTWHDKVEWTSDSTPATPKRYNKHGLIPRPENIFLRGCATIYNTSLNKFPVKHMDGTTVVKSIWFLDSTNLQTLSVKISWQSDL